MLYIFLKCIITGIYENLYLKDNQLTRFDSAVFKSPLNGMILGRYSPLEISGSNSF